LTLLFFQTLLNFSFFSLKSHLFYQRTFQWIRSNFLWTHYFFWLIPLIF
jgi:hypothetical protein